MVPRAALPLLVQLVKRTEWRKLNSKREKVKVDPKSCLNSFARFFRAHGDAFRELYGFPVVTRSLRESGNGALWQSVLEPNRVQQERAC